MRLNKKDLFYRYTDFTTMQNIGAYWYNQLFQYVTIGHWITEIGLYSLVFDRFNVPFFLVVIFVIGKDYFRFFVNWIVGKIAIKTGIYSAQTQYNAKKEHISPFNSEMVATLEEICKKVGAESKFTKL